MRPPQHWFSLIRMVAVFRVSRSCYYAWRMTSLTPSTKAVKRIERDVLIKDAFDVSKARNSGRHLQVALREIL